VTKNGRFQIPLFFALSLFAWVIWLPQVAARFELLDWAPSVQSPLNALTVWSPGLAAMFLSWRASGKSGIGALFGSLGAWRMPVKWYVIALLLTPGIWALALTIDRALGRTYELGPALLTEAFSASAAFMIPIAVAFTLPNALGEELGWRAFALPRLQARYGAVIASVVIGLFWGFWHVPGWIAWSATESAGLPAWAMVVNTVPLAILFTWLFNRTRGSLLLACLFHASITNTGYFLPKLPTITEAVLLWLIATTLVVSRELSRSASDLA
jgi:membrane protease YdiL (CAAX protease family)